MDHILKQQIKTAIDGLKRDNFYDFINNPQKKHDRGNAISKLNLKIPDVLLLKLKSLETRW